MTRSIPAGSPRHVSRPQLHRSIFFSGGEKYGSALVFLLSSAVLSRLLTPAELGLCAAVIPLTAVATAWAQEFGGASYLIQKPTLSERDISTAFSIALCLSALV